MKIQIRSRKATPQQSLTIQPAKIHIRTRPLRVLDFDIENRPLSYLGSDFTTAEVTALAWAWIAEDADAPVTVYLLGETSLDTMLQEFVAAYEQADLVTGHFIRGHDLPMINGALVEQGLPVLPDKMTQDTKLDFVRTKGLSLSQESLGAMLRLEHNKVTMNQARWRAANRLTPEGVAAVRDRVTGDVRQHIELRRELLKLNYLSPPKLWKSGMARVETYTP